MKRLQFLYMLVGIFLLLQIEIGNCYAEGIRVIPRMMEIKRDSLHMDLQMDLNSVKVTSGLAYIFTPVLRYEGKYLSLPPVIVSGNRRANFDRRERALSPDPNQHAPYRIIIDNRKRPSKELSYLYSIPYASWMRNASLLLMRESKNCCVRKLLSVDTLSLNIAAKGNVEPVEGTLLHTTPAVATPVTVVAQPAVPVMPVTVPVVLPSFNPGMYASMVSYLKPDVDDLKSRIRSAVLYIDYLSGRYTVDLDYKNNKEEINKIDSLLRPVLDSDFSTIHRIIIRGYASPDGNYKDNERLSSNRSMEFMHYVRDAYKMPESLFHVSWVPEDWDGTETLLNKQRPPYYREALDIIHRYGIFEGREKNLMELHGGRPYRDMLKTVFPKLRRLELTLEYRVRHVNSDEAAKLIYTRPELLSLEEMYNVAAYYRPGTEQYREIYEIAAYHFPNDVIANVNAASAVMLTGDTKSAWDYLRKVESDPRAWNNLGVLTLMEGDPDGAIVWFRKAAGVEPEKARKNLQTAEGVMNGERRTGKTTGVE